MTNKISLLMFTCNDIGKAVKNLKITEPYVEEIIIIDSSNRGEKELLKEYCSTTSKAIIFHVASLGYAEPYRTYGISKCKNDWIFLLDADEEPSQMLLDHLSDTIKVSEANYINALFLRRYEKKIPSGFSTWQLRIFKKGFVVWRGLLHEHPQANSVLLLEAKGLYLIHHHENNINRHYYKIQDTFLIESPMKTFIRSIFLNIRRGKSPEFSALFPKKMSLQDSAIQNNIRKEGITRYLNLDVEEVVRSIEEKYRDGLQGIDLLIKLLREKQSGESS